MLKIERERNENKKLEQVYLCVVFVEVKRIGEKNAMAHFSLKDGFAFKNKERSRKEKVFILEKTKSKKIIQYILHNIYF